MGEGCTDCGRKGGCDHRKRGMFDAIDQALVDLYPGRRWSERAEPLGDDPASVHAPELARRLGGRLSTLALHVPGGAQEYCDYVYVLCLGRTPALLELREGRVAGPELLAELGDQEISELYLRVALSALSPFAAVQQVSVYGRCSVSEGQATSGAAQEPPLVVIEEVPRTGVFDPPLLPRLRTLVAVLAELGVRHLDFGEITAAPDGFDAGDYGDRYGGVPAVANYLFYPQPASSITTTAVVLSHRGGIE